MRDRRWMTAIPAVILMCMIFFFSSQEQDDSMRSSMLVSRRLAAAVDAVGGLHMTQEEEAALAASMEGAVRKCAHALEYFLLAISVWHMFRPWIGPGALLKKGGFLESVFRGKSIEENREILLYFVTVIFCALYAGSDEFHQLFVSGRSGSLRDVCVDSAGASLGALLVLALEHRRRIRKKQSETDRA